MTVRIRRRGDGKGYLRIRADGEDVEGTSTRTVAVHRLAAYAWGEIDSLDAPLDIHHSDACPAHNGEENLRAVERPDHAAITNRQRSQRGRRA